MEHNTKKMRRIILFLLLGVFAFLLSSCNKEIPKDEEQTTYVVSLNFVGDISVTDEPLTKGTATNDLYGINVYYDGTEANNISDIYAYGLFDNIGDMTIPLLSGHKYKFECTLVKNGKTKLESSNVGKYEAPFGQILQNQFIVGSNTVMSGIKVGKSRMKGDATDTETPKLDRYYGETTNYVPTVGGSVVINLLRTVFGAKFIITGLVNDGTLTASCSKDANTSSEKYWTLTTTENVEGSAIIYTFPDVYGCWANQQTYTLGGVVSTSYDSNRGAIWDISATNNVTWKRNVLTTVTINMSPDQSGGGIVITEEAMGTDNEINVGINGDGVIDTDVEPKI